MKAVGQFVLFAVLTILSSNSFLMADQNAPELPGLFDELRVAEDGATALRLEAEIWQHWLTAPDELESKSNDSLFDAQR